MTIEANRDVTVMLQAVAEGDPNAAAQLLPLVYAELRALAEFHMRKTPPGQTLQATALVHESYLRLVGKEDQSWENRGHFFFAAARAMRDILVEQARRKATLKRGKGRRRVDVSKLEIATDAPADDLLALDDVLQRLEQDDPGKHRLVMLRFFAGLTAEESALALDVSVRTVERDWRFIKAKLHKELTGTNGVR
jgi:RNA polymerase sigma factor (TIGR02999 family)